MAIKPGNKTLFYHPEVRAYILTWKGVTIDVSRDIVSGSVTRLVDSASVWQLELNNKNLKYTGKISRMDRVVIYLKRTKWVQVMSGYVTSVPAVDLFPSTTVISGQCTLKRILHTWWDPKLPASGELLIQKALDQPDAGLGQMLIDLLTKVGTWERGSVHIQQIPPAYKELIEKYMPRQDHEENKQRILDKIAPGWTGGVSSDPMGADGEVISGEGPRVEGLHAHVYRAKQLTFKTFPAVKTIGGLRPGDPQDHGQGLALDVMVPVRSKLGDDIADWFWRNRKGFHVKYIIWKQRIISTARESEGWKHMADRGSITQNHYDHLHISFYPYTGPGRPAPATASTTSGSASGGGLNAFLYALRTHESGRPGGNYTAKSSISSASGAYQYLDSTWANYGGYKRAFMAPPAVQDKRAAADISRVYAKYKSWEACCTVHFTGHYVAPGSAEWNRRPSPGNPTVKDYVASVMRHMSSYNSSQAVVSGVTATGIPGAGAIGSAVAGVMALAGGGASTTAPTSGQARVDYFNRLCEQAKAAGISVRENSRFDPVDPVHTTNSWHYRGNKDQAADMSGGGGMAEWKLWANYFYAHGFRTILEYPGHYNHLHADCGPKGSLGYKPSESGPFPTGLSVDGAAPTGDVPAGDAAQGLGPESIFNALYTLPQDPGDGLLNTIPDRALIDDRPLMETVQSLVKSGMRSFMSGPNGDFVAFFPDYFGLYKTAPKFQLEDIEMKDVKITASDDEFTTHVFASGDSDGVGGVTVFDWMNTSGVVSIEQDFVLDQLVNAVDSEGSKLTTDAIFKRYGARPFSVSLPSIRQHEFEFFQALQIFMQKWAGQYSTRASFTFMPELYPGMRILFRNHDISVYVEQVTHTFSYEQGFNTEARISCPSTIHGTVNGLPFIGES